MTDHTDDAGFTDLGDAHATDGDHDPLIAERFRVLDRVTPPVVSPEALAVPEPGGWRGADPSRRRSGFLVAVAASVVVLLAGVVAVVAATDGGESSEEAGSPGEVPVVADSSSDTTAPLVVEGESGAVSTTRSEADGEESDTADESVTSADGATASDGFSEGDAGSNRSSSSNDSTEIGSDSDSEPGGSSGPATSTTVGSAVTVPAADGDRPVSTFSTATTDVLPTTAGGSGASSGTVALSGTVTEVFTDCVSRLLLTETGQVVQGGPVSCDGGSYIVVDGSRVFTSSGFTSADLAFDKHPSNLKPGTKVSVTATRIGSTGPLTLACDVCRVRII